MRDSHLRCQGNIESVGWKPSYWGDSRWMLSLPRRKTPSNQEVLNEVEGEATIVMCKEAEEITAELRKCCC
mgnify:CR=1 FL=1